MALELHLQAFSLMFLLMLVTSHHSTYVLEYNTPLLLP